jgi:hypothetical protein
MAEARSQQAASLTEFHWLGHRFPISNAKTRVAILKGSHFLSMSKTVGWNIIMEYYICGGCVITSCNCFFSKNPYLL